MSHKSDCFAIISAKGSCGHARTLQLFNESINSPIGFKSYSCSSYNDFQSGACNGNQMAYMGDGTETR